MTDRSLATIATAPTPAVVVVPIIVSWSARIFALLRMLLGFFAALAALGVATGDAELLNDEFSLLRYVEMLIAGILIPIAAISAWSNLRSAFARRARLEVLTDRLAIYHGGVFRAPLAIARSDIEAVAFDDRPFRYKRSGNHARFDLKPEGSDEDRPLGWLYSRSGGAPLPLLSQVFDVPNVAVLFTGEKILRPVRRWQKAFPSKVRMGPPLHKRRSRGFMARVKNASALSQALEEWDVVRPITWADLDAHSPPESDRARVRRLTWRDDAILFVVVVGQAAIPLLIALND